MPQFLADHLLVRDHTTSYPYTSINQGRSPVIPREGLNREQHGKSLERQMTQAVEAFDGDRDLGFVYVVFKSPPDFFLDLDKLEDSGENIKLKTYKRLPSTVVGEDGEPYFYYEATVYLNTRAISTFLRKIEGYITRDTPKGHPLNRSLIANIEEIRAATLKSFWQEPELPFPENDERVWWEIWLSRVPEDNVTNPIGSIAERLGQANIQIADRFISFPEHFVYLMKANVDELGRGLLYSDKLAEIRKPGEIVDFFTGLPYGEQTDWVNDLRNRVDFQPDQVSVCLLDSGVTIANPLLTDLIPQAHLDTVNPAWRKDDIHPNGGHGTPMAGLAFYGDLTELLAHRNRVEIKHHLESIKIVSPNHSNDPALYGAITIEAVSRGEIINPQHKRIVCMAVGSDTIAHRGRPTSWSAAVDQIVFGAYDDPNQKTIFFIAAGNIDKPDRINYPLINKTISIEDPGQSFNAITVGAYTLKDNIDLQRYPSATPLAVRGAMAPCSTTSYYWENEWCRKPDIVMEGGNHALFRQALAYPDSLLILSTGRGGINVPWLHNFGDTSGATALASRFGAILYQQYPELWPETIRGLVIHSADWTSEMLRNRHINQLSLDDKRHLLSHVGYGVPNMVRARHSANNSLSLIAEREIKPYKLEASQTKTDEFHLFDLPWPKEALEALHETSVKLKVTLSYFIEPNPNNKNYQLAAGYRSHGLRFKMIDRNERETAFRSRISRAMRGDDYQAEGSENWILGDQIRNKGSIHKDIWEGLAIDLASRNKIAVYPVGGWWKTRKKLLRYNNKVRYSIIVTIETPETLIDVDIYTSVANLVQVDI
ncbi:subtilisin family serine protease [Chitinophaga sp. W2I13]|uniref:S8 family peptidase n=1 Tax=Chitinophaga sp. W2I13 TaxID=3373923 RepID=UPI003D1B917F